MAHLLSLFLACSSAFQSKGVGDRPGDRPGDGGTAGDGGSGRTEPLVLEYPDQRVGMFYLAWHAYASQAWASLPADQQHTVEDVVRGSPASFAELVYEEGLYGTAQAFHWHQEPQAGFYCLYRPRGGEDSSGRPVCADIEATAELHATLLWEAGIDFVYVDLTNLSTWSDFADVLGLRPFEVLLEEWGALRARGVPTPQIAAWMPLWTVAADQEALVHRVLDAYAAASPDLLLSHEGQPVLFVVGYGDTDSTLLAEVQTQGLLAVPLWGNLSQASLDAGTAGWMQPCTVGGSFTTLVEPSVPCAQGYTASSPLGTVVSVSRSYQVGYASLPLQASGRLGGLTLQKQMETALSVQPDYLLFNAWNEHIAQPQANPYASSLGGLRQSMGVTGRSGDSADWLWVDMYGSELGRDFEPTVQDGGEGYALLESCLRVWRSGATTCADGAEACCQTAEGRVTVRSFRAPGGGVVTADHVPSKDAVEIAALLADGWTEACNPHYGPPGLCGGECEGRTVEHLLGYAAAAPSSEMPRPLTRCLSASGIHLHWLDTGCPAGSSAEAVLGYVR